MVFFGQWRYMSRFNQYGVVNYITQITDPQWKRVEKNTKRIISEVISQNGVFDENNIKYYDDKALFCNEYMVDPLNNNYVYVIHAISSIQEGVKVMHVFFYYIENRLRYFYEIDSGDKHIWIVFDPALIEITKNKKD